MNPTSLPTVLTWATGNYSCSPPVPLAEKEPGDAASQLSTYRTDTVKKIIDPTTQAWGLSLFQLPWPVFVPFIYRRYVQFSQKSPLNMALDVSLSEKLIAHQKFPPVDSLWSWEGKLGGFCLAVWLMMHPLRDSMGLLLPSVTLEVLSSCSAPGQHFTPIKTSYCLVSSASQGQEITSVPLPGADPSFLYPWWSFNAESRSPSSLHRPPHPNLAEQALLHHTLWEELIKAAF